MFNTFWADDNPIPLIHTFSEKLWLCKTCSPYHTYPYNHMLIKWRLILKFDKLLNQRDTRKALQQ